MDNEDKELLMEELKARRSQKMLAITDLEVEVDGIEIELANMACPYSIGEEMLSKDGKTRCTVEAIRFSAWGNDGYRMTIRKIKKDGKPFVYTSDYYESQWTSTGNPAP